MTDLIEQLKKAVHKIGFYMMSEKSWIDVGQWEEYKKTLREFSL